MNWLLPGFLGAAAAIALPVVLHFLRSKPKTLVLFPSLRFLGEAAIRDTRRHRLRRWITLALRCLIIGLLAAAFARPFWVAADAAHRQVMIVAVDNSMSMQAGTRWADRKAWALEQLARLRAGDEAGVLLINPAPVWLVPLSADLGRVRGALGELAPGYEKTHFSAALRLAGDVLAATPGAEKTILWMSDEQKLGWLDVKLGEPLPPGVKIRFADAAAEPKREAGIARVQRDGDSVALTIRLYHPDTDQRTVTISSAGKVLLTRDLKLTSGENKVSIPLPRAENLRVSLDPDDFAADDTAWLAASSTTGHPVLIDTVSGGVDFLAHALESTRLLDTAALRPAPLPASDWPGGGIAILRNGESFRGDAIGRLEKFLRAGGNAWIVLDGSKEETAWLATRGIHVTPHAADPSGDPMHLRDWDPDHPILKAFAGESLLPLMQVDFYSGYDVAGESLEPVARWPDGAVALAELDDGQSRLFLTGVPLDRAFTNWPVQPSFVPFVHQAVRWLASISAAQSDWHVGDNIPLTTSGTWQAIDSPVTQPARAVAQSVRPDAPGLYEFASGDTKTNFAVNVPPEESALASWANMAQLAALQSTESETTSVVAAPFQISDEAAEARQRLWWWLLAICAAALFAELAIANRTAA
jgi:hypothetical protein